jgi:hypothetical protein
MAKITVLSLGEVQAALEAATRSLKLAQSNFIKASVRLQEAEEKHAQSTVEMVNTAATVRAANRVVPIALRG